MTLPVVPAKAGTQTGRAANELCCLSGASPAGIPAFAGMTNRSHAQSGEDISTTFDKRV